MKQSERMGFDEKMVTLGKYQLGRTIGEGNFSKVKLAIDTTTSKSVAIKIMNKPNIIAKNLIYQVQNEIKTMKLLQHPNIVRIHEVIGTKTKIYIVMEYISGGQLSTKMSYVRKLSESEARKLFQQLIDAVWYCHDKGVYHRDLKPENLLLDSKGNLKVSDFGLSAMCKSGNQLTTACGSPSYVAPELLSGKSYDGAAADVWSCGVILFELLAGYLPFDDRNLIKLYKKILAAKFTTPHWVTGGLKQLISRMFEPNPRNRITMCQIMQDVWFQTNYEPAAMENECRDKISVDDVQTTFDPEENSDKVKTSESSNFINAFQLIAMSNDLDLSGLFEEKDTEKQRTRIGSEHAIDETIMKIEEAAKDASLLIQRTKNLKMRMHQKLKMPRCKSYATLLAEVIEVAPTHCVVEISKSVGELGAYNKFCKSLSGLLRERSCLSIEGMRQQPQENNMKTKIRQETESPKKKHNKDDKTFRGYSSN